MSAQKKPAAPVVGFNHNISYKGRTFHVQTEDSGAAHAHIMTHLFVGGNILASRKLHYNESVQRLSGSELFDDVRKQMQEQHKGMIRELLKGNFDTDIATRLGDSVYRPGELAGGTKAPGLLVGGAGGKDRPESESIPLSVSNPSSKRMPLGKHAELTPGGKREQMGPSLLESMNKASPPAESDRKATEVENPPFHRILFADDVASDRRLDEVILQYLATTLDEQERK